MPSLKPNVPLVSGSGPAAIIVGVAVVSLAVFTGLMWWNSRASDPFANSRPEFARLEERADLAKATFAGGCFWCIEAPFEQEEGIEAVMSGYTGGQVEHPTYQQVLTGRTGHRESVRVYYHPEQISYQQLLDIYWLQIDPTDDGGQFSDRGSEYTTAIYTHDDDQRRLAEQSRQAVEQSGRYQGRIVTEVLPAEPFYPAEDHHQDYYLRNAERYQRYHALSGRRAFIESVKDRLQGEKR